MSIEYIETRFLLIKSFNFLLICFIFLSQIITFAPDSTNLNTHASPIPDEPPVIMIF